MAEYHVKAAKQSARARSARAALNDAQVARMVAQQAVARADRLTERAASLARDAWPNDADRLMAVGVL